MMEDSKDKGPVALAHTDGYATMLVVQDLKRVIQDLVELRERNLMPAAYTGAMSEIQVRCRMMAQRLEEEVRK